MAKLDEELRRGLERLAPHVDPDGVVERVLHRGRRKRVMRRAGRVALAICVIGGTIAGVVALSRVFSPTGPGAAWVLASPAPIAPHENGLLAYTQDGIVIAREDGALVRTLPSPAPGIAWYVAWSPDGERLAVAVFGDPERSLWVMGSDGTHPVEVASGDNVGRPSWSPDGEWIAFTLERGNTTEVHVARPDGTDDRIVRVETEPGTHAIFSATFSPDGAQIVFDAGTDSGYDIFVMDADGSNVRPLTRTGTDYNPSWSPNGRQIVFTRQEAASESDIFLMDADGSNLRRLTDGGPQLTNLNAGFAPDGNTIVYEAARNGGTGPMVQIGLDGSDPRVLVHGEVLSFSWQAIPAGSVSSPVQPTITDLGLGFPVCTVSSVTGDFSGNQNVKQTAWVATKAGDAGPCPDTADGFHVLALDVTGDGVADTSVGPIECKGECRAFAAPDVDHDGVDEIAVAVGSTGGSIEYQLYTNIESGIERLEFDCASCNAATFSWGRPGGHAEGAYCLRGDTAGDLVTWAAERTDDGKSYSVVRTIIDVTGRILTEVDRSDSFVPYDPAALPPGGGEDFCGAPVNP